MDRFLPLGVVVFLLLSVGIVCGQSADPRQEQETPATRTAAEPAEPAAAEPAEPAPAEAAEQAETTDTGPSLVEDIKHPFPWLAWGFDIRLRETYIANAITLDKRHPDHEWHWQRQRVRLWSTVTPLEDIEINLRIAWEGKHFDRPLSFENWRPTSVIFDRLNLKWSDIGGSGVTLQAGRQELMLGDRWLVMDGAPLVGSSYAYFDAVRLTLDFDSIDTRADLIYLDQDAEGDSWICPLEDRDSYILEHDETGAIVWLTNNSLENTQFDTYFIYANRTPVQPTGDQAEIYTIGGRIEQRFSENVSAFANLAGQFGRKNGRRLCAFGALSRLTYAFHDEWKNVLRLDYEHLSGDDPGDDSDGAFDILWGRWPRFSEMYLYTNANETRIGGVTNLHRVSVGWTGSPTDKLQLSSDYHLLFADENTSRDLFGFSESGCFRGQLFSTGLKYNFTEQLSGHLLGEFFFPGGYYSDDRNDPAVFLRAELSYSF
jgi:hypothetical protein